MNLTKRNVLAVVLVVGVSTIAGAGSYAYLTDSDVSDISFMTGSLEVEATPDTMDFGDVAESSPTAEVSIRNNGSLPARQVLWTDLDLSGSPLAAQATVVEHVEYRGEDVTNETLSQVDGAGNGNGIYDLNDVSSHLDGDNIDLEEMVGGDGLDPNGEETADLAVTIRVDYGQGINVSNMDVTASMGVTGRQQAPENATAG